MFGADGRLEIPYDHLALRVRTDDGTGPWLVDVGFGDHSHHPLALDRSGDQHDPAAVFRFDRFDDTPEGGLDLSKDGKPQFRLDQRPRDLAEFEVGAWWHRTSPKSHFTRSLVCSRLTPEGRITLTGRTLVTTVEGVPTKTPLPTDAAVLTAYGEHFGITLDTVPTVSEPRVSYPE